MKEIIKITGAVGAGKADLLNAINALALRVNGATPLGSIIQATTDRQNAIVLIEDCTPTLLAEFEAIVPGSAVWGRIKCIYAVMKP